MKKNTIGIWLSFLSLLSHSGLGAVAPSSLGLSHPRVSIARVGNLEGSDSKESFRLFEHRLLRFLEDQPIGLKAQSIATTLSSEDLKSLSVWKTMLDNATRLKELLETRFSKDETMESLAAELEKNILALPVSYVPGRDIQWSQWVLAAYYWGLGEKAEATRWARNAIALHPLGILAAKPQWDLGISFFNPIEFDEAMRSEMGRQRRHCELSLQGIPSDAHVQVNGFLVRETRTAFLSDGSHYWVEIHRGGDKGWAKQFHCERQARWTWTVSKEGERPLSFSLARVWRDNTVDLPALLLIDLTEKDRLTLYRFSANKGLVKLKEMSGVRLAQAFQKELPISEDSILALASSPGGDFINGSSAMDLAQSRSLSFDLGDGGAPQADWYSNWKLWAVVGGLVGSVALFVAVSSSDSKVEGRASGIRIQLK